MKTEDKNGRSYTTTTEEERIVYWKQNVAQGLVLVRYPHQLGYSTRFVRPDHYKLRKVETKIVGGVALSTYEENY